MQLGDDRLMTLARSVVESMGYELVGVEYFQRGSHGAVLRVYIDRESGITLDDCAAVSHQFSGVLDVEDPLSGHYDLEISSPGLDRPLFTTEHFERFRGRRARLRLVSKLDGRRNFEGVLGPVSGDALIIEMPDASCEIPLDLIESARLVPEL